jgi:hypothetical protein
MRRFAPFLDMRRAPPHAPSHGYREKRKAKIHRLVTEGRLELRVLAATSLH